MTNCQAYDGRVKPLPWSERNAPKRLMISLSGSRLARASFTVCSTSAATRASADRLAFHCPTRHIAPEQITVTRTTRSNTFQGKDRWAGVDVMPSPRGKQMSCAMLFTLLRHRLYRTAQGSVNRCMRRPAAGSTSSTTTASGCTACGSSRSKCATGPSLLTTGRSYLRAILKREGAPSWRGPA